jgi:hypothetical protein
MEHIESDQTALTDSSVIERLVVDGAEEVIVSDADVVVDDGKVPVAKAFAHAIAMGVHQHNSATPEDAPPTPVRLPFPRPPFDVEKHHALMFDQLARIDALKIEALKADDHAKRASELKKDAHQAVADAHEELDRQVRILRDEHAAAGDEPEPVQLPLTASGRTPCAWEREHPLEVCATCSRAREEGRKSEHDVEAAPVDAPPAAEPATEKDERVRVRTTIDGCLHYLTEQATGELVFQPERSAATAFADHEDRAAVRDAVRRRPRDRDPRRVA